MPKKVSPEIVAELIVEMISGDICVLFHSWDEITITEDGINLNPNAPRWEFDWSTVKKIVVINTRSPYYLKSNKILEENNIL